MLCSGWSLAFLERLGFRRGGRAAFNGFPMAEDSVQIKVKLNLEPLDRISRSLRRQSLGGEGPVRDTFRQWAGRWRSFTRQRFDRLSKFGGGEWDALEESTKEARARKKQARGGKKHKKGTKVNIAGRRFSILRDNNLLFGAISQTFARASKTWNKPGGLQEDIKEGIRAGYGGPSLHKDSAGKTSVATIADIASFHQTGAGHLPERKIVVSPDDATIRRMNGDLERGVKKLISQELSR